MNIYRRLRDRYAPTGMEFGKIERMANKEYAERGFNGSKVADVVMEEY